MSRPVTANHASKRSGRVSTGLRHLAWSIAPVIVTAACSRAPAGAAGNIEPQYNKTTGRLELLRYDANGNGVVETFSYMDGNRVIRVEVDTDEDGQIDRWEHYGDGGALERVGFSRDRDGRESAWSYADDQGRIVRIDVAEDGDGRVTRREYYERDVLVRSEQDVDGDGAMDKWEQYEGGRLIRLAFDTDHRGVPTQTFSYGSDGTFRVESDIAGESRSVLPQR
jgi:hypothetical protein